MKFYPVTLLYTNRWKDSTNEKPRNHLPDSLNSFLLRDRHVASSQTTNKEVSPMKFIFKIAKKSDNLNLYYPEKWQDIEPILVTQFPDIQAAHYVAQELSTSNNTLVRYECERFFTVIRPLTPKEKAEVENARNARQPGRN
jgi:hypothetical protein